MCYLRCCCQLSQALLQMQVSLFDAVFHQCSRDEETHFLEGADKREQTLCDEDDFCLETVPGTCGGLFFHFHQQPLNTSCRLTRDECRHPFLIDDYTVLTQHRIGQGKACVFIEC